MIGRIERPRSLREGGGNDGGGSIGGSTGRDSSNAGIGGSLDGSNLDGEFSRSLRCSRLEKNPEMRLEPRG